MVSQTLWLVAQINGKLTKRRYQYATVFVDQLSGYGYVHLQVPLLAADTIEGKHAFEMQYCWNMSRNVIEPESY